MDKKIALITGASSGIGKSTAFKFKKEGYTVYAAARRIKEMQDLSDQGINVLKLDITQDKSIVECLHNILDKEKQIDIVINNAGFGLFGSVEETSIKDAKYQFEVNLFGLARLTQLVIPQMQKQKSGIIVNISSVAGKIYSPLGAWYHATKHALEGWSDCLRIELKDFGIKVVIIEPGIINTSFGSIMQEQLLKISGKGKYKKLANQVLNAFKKANKDNIGSPPEIVAEKIYKAISAKNPNRRYAVGKYSKVLLFMKKWFPESFFEYGIMKRFK